jgi:hypothetical protein
MHSVDFVDTDSLPFTAIVERAISPQRFFTADDLAVRSAHDSEQLLPWELYQGRLVNPRHTRRLRSFESWTIEVQEAGQPVRTLLSILRALDGPECFVTRQIQSWVWEAYEPAPNVFESLLVARGVTELVGTIDLRDCSSPEDLESELTRLVWRAVIGLSRLPLTSIEAPIPEFSLGRLGYFPDGGHDEEARTISIDALKEGRPYGPDGLLIEAKRLELAIRATPPPKIVGLANSIVDRIPVPEFLKRLRVLFNEVALSPYTDFAAKTLVLLNSLRRRGYLSAAQLGDFLSWLLRHLVRHLTAYDLIRFHHRGANYPDALLLDELLSEFITLLQSAPELGQTGPAAAVRRRALRQALLVRLKYQNLPVPPLPTSLGENARVLPPPFGRVAEEQIAEPGKRSLRLFGDRPFEELLAVVPRPLWVAAFEDLARPQELAELGMAIFLDRPLGAEKPPGAADQTPLLSHNAFSRSIAVERLLFLREKLAPICDAELPSSTIRTLNEINIAGIRIDDIESECRPGVVSLADARLAAEDFVITATTARSRRDFLGCFDFRGCRLDWLEDEPDLLLLPRCRPTGVRILDHRLQPRLDLFRDSSQGYCCHGGVELPRNGLRIGAAWDSNGVRMPLDGTIVPRAQKR